MIGLGTGPGSLLGRLPSSPCVSSVRRGYGNAFKVTLKRRTGGRSWSSWYGAAGTYRAKHDAASPNRGVLYLLTSSGKAQPSTPYRTTPYRITPVLYNPLSGTGTSDDRADAFEDRYAHPDPDDAHPDCSLDRVSTYFTRNTAFKVLLAAGHISFVTLLK